MNSKLKIVVGLLAGTLLSGCSCMSGQPREVARNEPVVREQARAMLADPTPTDVVVEQALKPVYFKYDSNELTPSNREILRENSEWAANNPNRQLTIEGNCDERGTTEYNIALGQRRAQAAFDYLRNLGVESSRMTTISYGEENPVDLGHNEQAWAKNRRVDTIAQE